MTNQNLTPTELLGKYVTFFVDLFGQKIVQSGIVSSVCMNLDGDHGILISDFGDFYKLSEVHDLKVTGVPV